MTAGSPHARSRSKTPRCSASSATSTATGSMPTGGATLRGHQSRHRRADRHRAEDGRRRNPPRHRSRAGALPAWAAKTAKERADILRRWYDLMLANQDDLADDHDRRAGQAARGIERRDRLRRQLHRVVRRGRQAPLRRRHSRPPARQAHPRAAPAGRRRRRDHAVEFPGRDDHAQGRARRSRRAARSSASPRRRRRTPRSRMAELGRARRHSAGVLNVLTGGSARNRRRDDLEPASCASSPSPAPPRSARS